MSILKNVFSLGGKVGEVKWSNFIVVILALFSLIIGSYLTNMADHLCIKEELNEMKIDIAVIRTSTKNIEKQITKIENCCERNNISSSSDFYDFYLAQNERKIEDE